MSTPSGDEAWVAEAQYRYYNDPRFHAVVDTAVYVAVEEVRRRTDGGVVQRHERNDLTMACAVALVLAEADAPQSAAQNAPSGGSQAR